ncbi:MAG TPA: PilT/PilU family type 4a pilus ATPase [Polyangiaceae bacterium]|jgi:twitching motility protein PilT
MARVDSLLSILVQQGANELRLGTDKEPKMLAFGTPKRLSIPVTPEDTLRELLGEVLTPDRDKLLKTQGRVDTSYEAAGLGGFHVKLSARAGGFDVVFVRESKKAPPATSAPTPAVAFAPTSTLASAQPSALSPYATSVPSPSAAAAPAPSQAASLAQTAAISPAPVDETPTPTLVRLLAAAFALRASDLHLTDGRPPLVRVDGALRSLGDEPVDLATTVAHSLVQGFSADAAVELPGTGRARLHVFRTANGLCASVRLLPAAAPSLASLHMPVPLEDLVEIPHGLVLVCGATGSGKSTTLAALAQEALRKRSIVLTTLEDPIEHGLVASETSLVRRRQIGRDARDFASGLRDALREDPDVLLLGEMRDPETIGLALTAAETGHLVLSSLHSGSAASTIERIVDAYPPARQGQIRVQLADALRAVVVQRLLPRARGTGRVVALEVLRVTHAVASLVRDGKTSQFATAIQSGRREGMISLERCLADRVQSGDVRIEDARAAANDPASLAMYIGKPDR